MTSKALKGDKNVFDIPGVMFNPEISDPKERIQAFINAYAFDGQHHFEGFDESLMREHVRVISATGTPTAKATFEITIPTEFTNRMGNLHGGAMAMIFDMCTTMSAAPLSRRDFWLMGGVSRSLSVTYLRPVPAGMEVLVECEVLQMGARLATMRGEMKSKKDGKLLAVGEHTKASVNVPQPPAKL